MTPRRPLKIAPCPRPGCRCAVYVQANNYNSNVRVRCSRSGWCGPWKRSDRAAILAWNPRSDAEAERRGAMAVARWFTRKFYCGKSVADSIRAAIKRGEVLPAKEKKGARKR